MKWLKGLFSQPEPERKPECGDSPPPTTIWVMETPSGRGYVWPNTESYHPGTGGKHYHWKATIHHQNIGSTMEAHYLTPEAARNAVEAMLSGNPNDWQAG